MVRPLCWEAKHPATRWPTTRSAAAGVFYFVKRGRGNLVIPRSTCGIRPPGRNAPLPPRPIPPIRLHLADLKGEVTGIGRFLEVCLHVPHAAGEQERVVPGPSGVFNTGHLKRRFIVRTEYAEHDRLAALGLDPVRAGLGHLDLAQEFLVRLQGDPGG